MTSKITPPLTFEDTKAGIKIQYPANWNKEIGHDMVIFSPPEENYRDKEDSGLWLMGDRTKSNNIGDYVQERIENIQTNHEDVKILESSNTAALSGRPAYKLVYLRRSSDKRSLVKRIEIATILDNKVYIVNGGSEAKYYTEIFPALERMISSFELTSTKPAS